MKITIDTQEKTISVEGNVNLIELFNKLDDLLPNNEWNSYTLLQSSLVYTPYYPMPTFPYYEITCEVK